MKSNWIPSYKAAIIWGFCIIPIQEYFSRLKFNVLSFFIDLIFMLGVILFSVDKKVYFLMCEKYGKYVFKSLTYNNLKLFYIPTFTKILLSFISGATSLYILNKVL